ITVESIDATGALVEQVTVPTRRDSIPGQPGGLSTFRIMADFWGEPSFSTPVSGYSRDDIAPEAPTELTANSALNGAHLTWSPSVSQDVHHYNLYYSYSADSTPYFPWATVQTDTTVTTGVRPGFIAYFRVAAVDTAGQIGPQSEVASCVMPPVVEFTQAVAGTEGNHLVTLTWSLEAIDAVPEFALFRRLAPAEIWEPLVRDVVEKEDGVFEMIDTALPAGCEVAYRIDLKVGDGSWPLLETDTITMPSTPLSLTCQGNPFRETTRLMMYLPERASVGLDVFDVRGRRVADLHHAPLSGGWHPIVWTGQDDRGQRLSAGLYFAVLRSEKQQLIRKITLLR
nr:FlgD immunoglobulin-like domain containing protein [Candidatus Krumholzibacteria bacterium]